MILFSKKNYIDFLKPLYIKKNKNLKIVLPQENASGLPFVPTLLHDLICVIKWTRGNQIET